MKELFVLLVAVFLLVACGGKAEEAIETEEPVKTQEETTEPTQDELDAKLKAEATPLDFIAANGDKVAEGTKVTITGEVTNIAGEGIGKAFTVTTKEGDGYGMYTVKNITMKEVSQGDTVTVYGVYDGKDELSMPTIVVTVIE